MKKSFSFFIIFGILAILLISGCTQQQPAGNQTPVQTPAEQTAEQPTVKLSNEKYIVDDKGRTLYFFTKDIRGDSNCIGECLNKWPIFYQEKITVSQGLNSPDFGIIARNDGNKQNTFKGWPLYYFSGDLNPGDIKGEGVNNVWFIARPDYTVFIADKDNMKFFVDANGKTLYNFTKDTPDMSNCKGGCLNAWPVFYSENIIVPSMIKASDFGVITNSEGSKQITYRQMPLYYYINDTKPGDTNGQNVNNAWFIIEPDPVASKLPNTAQSPAVASSKQPTITVTSFPSTPHGDTNITIRWEVSGGTPGNISETAILWGYMSGGANLSDYSKATMKQTGKTLQQFNTGINIPPSGTLYFRAYGIVDGTNVFSQEYKISIIAQTSGY